MTEQEIERRFNDPSYMRTSLNHESVKNIIQTRMGISPSNCDARIHSSSRYVDLFKHEIDKGGNYYFILCDAFKVEKGVYTYLINKNKIQVYVIPSLTLSTKGMFNSKTNRYTFRVSNCRKVYDEEEGVFEDMIPIEDVPQKSSPVSSIPSITEEYEEDDMVAKDLPGDDIPSRAETLRDRACIMLEVPLSGKPWLNKLIEFKLNRK